MAEDQDRITCRQGGPMNATGPNSQMDEIARAGNLRCTNQACSLFFLKLEPNEMISFDGEKVLCTGCLERLHPQALLTREAA